MNLFDFIQLFAQPMNANYLVMNKTTDTTATTGNDLSPEMKTYYDRRLIDYAQAALVHDQFAQKRPIPKGSGKTIEFRKFTPLAKALTPLTEGITPAGSQLDVTAITATVAQYGDFVAMSDVLELTALDNVILEATKLLGRQAGKTLDTVTRNVLVAGTNVMFAPKIGAGGAETAVVARTGLDTTAVLTVDLIEQAVAKLRAVDAPTIGGDYICIAHPYALYDLMRDPDWRKPHEYTDTQNLYEGEVGKIGGARFISTTEAKIWKDSTCPSIAGSSPTAYYSVFGTLIFGEGAFGTTEVEGGGLQTIVKQKGSAGTADPLDQRSSVGWKAIKVAELLIPEYLIRIEHMSKRYSATVPAN